MTDYTFRIVNVFAQTRLGGNPLCVFEDARGLDGPTMQAIALQFNLSETTFVLPSSAGTARGCNCGPAVPLSGGDRNEATV